jgi:hypothetical protein
VEFTDSVGFLIMTVKKDVLLRKRSENIALLMHNGFIING